MAGQTAAQKAAEEKAAADQAAAEQAAASQPDPITEQSEDVEVEPERDLYSVTGAAVVLRTEDGFERYFYRGAVLDGAAFAASNIKHAIANGLIAATE